MTLVGAAQDAEKHSPMAGAPTEQGLGGSVAAAVVDRAEAMAIVSRCSTTPFLVKLWAMLDPKNAAALEWDATGESFEVKDPGAVAKDVLPRHFRHNNFSSFQRQLSYFGFRKAGRGSRGVRYSHQDFCLHRPHDVLRIRRKTNGGGAKGHHTNKHGLPPSSQVAIAAAASPAAASTAATAPAPATASPAAPAKPSSAMTPADLGISPHSSSCGDPTAAAAVSATAGAARRGLQGQGLRLSVAVPPRGARFDTRRAVSLRKRAPGDVPRAGEEEGGRPAPQQKRARAAGASDVSAPAPASLPVSSTGGLEQLGADSPTAALCAAASLARPTLTRAGSSGSSSSTGSGGGGGGSSNSLFGPRTGSFEMLSAAAFDSDPLLQPLSPMVPLTPLTLGGGGGISSDGVSDGWPTGPGDEPLSPLFTPRTPRSDALGAGANAVHRFAMHAAMVQQTSVKIRDT